MHCQLGNLLMTALELLGATIRSHRKRLGLTQKQLAAKTGLDHTYISEVERGLRNLTAKSLFRIAAALHCTLSQLVQPLDDHAELTPPDK